MEIELYYMEGCPNYQKVDSLLREILKEEGIHAEIRLIKVGSEEEARRYRFIGSPTVRINGLDVEPGARGVRQFRLAPRVYLDKGAHQGFPSKATLLKALREAQAGD